MADKLETPNKTETPTDQPGQRPFDPKRPHSRGPDGPDKPQDDSAEACPEPEHAFDPKRPHDRSP